ncbi:MAG: thioredoxin family protein [Bacteroidales bacterium]|jgi:thioredoxin-like negative regulator of GroEL|nr:thioredoxin family protein [Bacteroidales bacterium]HOI31657.1 thioredoxin family protein [Bacteroidales bacterium]
MQNTSLKSIQNQIAITPALLLYFFSDRCAPCISLRPKVEKLLSDKYPEMRLIYIDSEKQPEIAGHFGVFSNPTLLLYFDGHEHQRLSKYVAIPQLDAAISRPYELLID